MLVLLFYTFVNILYRVLIYSIYNIVYVNILFNLMMNSTNQSQVRLMRDLTRIEKEGEDSIFASPEENDIYHWEAVILGPDSSVWEGGVFKLDLKFTTDYPSKPPQIKFNSKIFHPNSKYCYSEFIAYRLIIF
jgi:hypothetical protein